MKKAIFNWSGGKDSAFALGEVLMKKEYDISFLMTSIAKENRRVSMHGIHESLMLEQAKSVGLPITFLELPELPDMGTYEKHLTSLMREAKLKGIEDSIFGDIFLEDLRQYRENQLQKIGFNAVFPLWKRDTKTLILDFIDQGYKTMISAVDASKLSKYFVGEIITKELIKELPVDVDPCGENGEFHTFVIDTPYFKFPLEVKSEESILKKYPNDNPEISSEFWFCPISLKNS
ncbi:diphthine--ammonia ligase [Lentimicrobium sp. L6]|uniref:Dph6-related ATP pyrophosphatase n=1 Tax=Lentimicrobium sp. L6 TaxID=2735916 RepID=UPI001553AAA8|nr:diphthine--ammonia ligase [Lentimicrobium sp. L6]NPD83516.1 diphthine--ammonia ligase [Lentimicrobium sp. L6]